jgi:hypothetical protein
MSYRYTEGKREQIAEIDASFGGKQDISNENRKQKQLRSFGQQLINSASCYLK